MSLQSEAARLAVLTAVRDAIDVEVKAARIDVLEGLQESARVGHPMVEVTLPDGTKVAKASLKEPSRRVSVVNEAALREWVAERSPLSVISVVEPHYLRDLLDRAVPAENETGDVFDPTTGEQIPGVMAHNMPAQAESFQLRFETGARVEILERFRQHGLGRSEHARELPVTAAEWSEVDDR